MVYFIGYVMIEHGVIFKFSKLYENKYWKKMIFNTLIGDGQLKHITYISFIFFGISHIQFNLCVMMSCY